MRVRGYFASLAEEIKRQQEEFVFRVYLTDSIRAQAQGRYMQSRWVDIVNPPKIDTRDPDTRLAEFIERAGLQKSDNGEEVTR